MMYTVKQLTEMYGTTRQTIHTKFKNPLLSPYIIRKDNEVRFDPDGINTLNIIMSESKVALRQNDGQDDSKMTQLNGENNKHNIQLNNNNGSQVDVKDNSDYCELYINQLLKRLEEMDKEKETIEKRFEDIIKELKKDKENAEKRCQEAERRYDELVNITVKPKLIEAPKKRFWLF